MEVIGRRHGHHRHRARQPTLDARNTGEQRPRKADVGLAVEHHRGHRTQRLDMEAQLYRREALYEGAQDPPEPLGRQHHIDGDVDFGFQSVEQAFYLGTQAIHHQCRGAGFGQNGAAGHGQLGFARAFALEQRQPELRFQVGNAVADHGNRAIELAACAGEAARIDDRQQDVQLVESGRARVVHFSISSNK
jgi:hypothetical protein